MEKTTAIITACAIKSHDMVMFFNEYGFNSNIEKNFNGDFYFEVILAIIKRICDKLGARVLKSEYYEENNRIAVLAQADISRMSSDIHTLREYLESAGKKLNVAFRVQKEDLFRYMHRV